MFCSGEQVEPSVHVSSCPDGLVLKGRAMFINLRLVLQKMPVFIVALSPDVLQRTLSIHINLWMILLFDVRIPPDVACIQSVYM